MKRAFVAGWPISHSLSPHLHGYWLRQYGIDGIYEAIAVEPVEFTSFLQSAAASGYLGGNITIPHKLQAFALCRKVDSAAARLGAVNTVWMESGLLCGANTDSYGFAASLDAAAPEWRECGAALVLGAGGAARAVVHAIAEGGVRAITVANRTAAKAHQLARLFDSGVTVGEWENRNRIAAGCGLIVNTTALGMSGQPPLDIDLGDVSRPAVVADIVYNPLETPLLRAARAKGLAAVDGLGMLMHQAAPGFESWFGKRPEVTQGLRRHLEPLLSG
jgi:shikimate dehydrogenase